MSRKTDDGSDAVRLRPEEFPLRKTCSSGSAEVEEFRTEYSKTYMLADGSFLSHVFSEPVHRRDDQDKLQPIETDQYWACLEMDAEEWGGVYLEA